MKSQKLIAKINLDRVHELAKGDELDEVLCDARRQLFNEHVLGHPPRREPQTKYQTAVLHAKRYAEANHKDFMETATPIDLKLLESEWGWWYMPGQQNRVEETKIKWKRREEYPNELADLFEKMTNLS